MAEGGKVQDRWGSQGIEVLRRNGGKEVQNTRKRREDTYRTHMGKVWRREGEEENVAGSSREILGVKGTREE